MVDISDYFKNFKPELHAVLFDWGNTVMKVIPNQQGPMASWTEVQCEGDIKNVLAALRGNFKLALVSNAKDSDCHLVRDALARVELNNFFDEIFTPHELNASKPAPDYFLNALKKLEVEPEQAIMIGENYQNDIIAAKQIGLWTVWYNIQQQPVDVDGYPYHDIEIKNLTEVLSFIRKKFNQDSLK